MLEVAIVAGLQGLILLFISLYLRSMKADLINARVEIQNIRTEVQLGTRQIGMLQKELADNHTDILKLLHDHEMQDMRQYASKTIERDVQDVSTRMTTLEATFKHIAGRRGQSSN